MSDTILHLLTKRNVHLQCYSRASTLTFNDSWSPIENVAPWTEFNYQNLLQRYGPDLNRRIQQFDPVHFCEIAGFHKVFDERGLSDVISSTIMLLVAYALPQNLFIAAGARTTDVTDVYPDWGAGNEDKFNSRGRSKALVVGETKYGWSYDDAIDTLRKDEDNYELDSEREIIQPFEQVQHYAKLINCRYAFLIYEKAFIVMRLSLSDDPVRTLPRPRRNIKSQPSHQRVNSDSTVSEVTSSVSAMSIDEDALRRRGADIGLVEYAEIPWIGRGDKMTITLASYCLIRLADEGNDLRHSYDPLGPSVTAPVQDSSRQTQQRTQRSEMIDSKYKGKAGGADWKGKGKAMDAGESARSAASHPESPSKSFRDVQAISISADQKFYTYKLDGKWAAEPVDKWKRHGDSLFHYKLWLRAPIPK